MSAPEAEARVPDAGRVVEGPLPGDRGIPSVNRARSAEARVTKVLSLACVGLLGGAALAWYYTGLATRQAQAAEIAAANSKAKAEGESRVPPLGKIEFPRVVAADAADATDAPDASEAADPSVAEETGEADDGDDDVSSVFGDPPPAPPLEPPPVRPRGGRYVHTIAGGTDVGERAAVPAGSERPTDTELERRLSGPAFAMSETTGSMAAPAGERGGAGGDLASRLQPTALSPAQARLLPTRRLLLPKGAVLDCTLETAIDSSLPGLVTCLTATDTFGADGRVVLLERGTRLVGEVRADVRRGASRLFVLWSEARTPTGVVVSLDSPGTNELGRTGVTGAVDRHFGERFGAAILVSVIDGAIQAGVEASRGGDSNSLVVGSSNSRDILTELLRDTVDIPPTISVPQGTRLNVLVARDLDFRTVYELELVRAAAR